MLSDFPIRPTQYKRLSKLVVALSLTTDMRDLMRQAFSREFKSVTTTAFTNRASSMKYRGLLKVASRKEKMVNYGADLARWTTAEAFAWWKKGHEQT